MMFWFWVAIGGALAWAGVLYLEGKAITLPFERFDAAFATSPGSSDHDAFQAIRTMLASNGVAANDQIVQLALNEAKRLARVHQTKLVGLTLPEERMKFVQAIHKSGGFQGAFYAMQTASNDHRLKTTTRVA
jgi:hypothetical protein